MPEIQEKYRLHSDAAATEFVFLPEGIWTPVSGAQQAKSLHWLMCQDAIGQEGLPRQVTAVPNGASPSRTPIEGQMPNQWSLWVLRDGTWTLQQVATPYVAESYTYQSNPRDHAPGPHHATQIMTFRQIHKLEEAFKKAMSKGCDELRIMPPR